MVEHKFSDIIEQCCGFAFKRRVKILVLQCAFAERKCNWSQHKNRHQNRNNYKRGIDAHRLHRNNVHREESHHCGEGGEARKNRWPSHFGDCVNGGLFAVVSFEQLRPEKTVNVYVVGNCNCKSHHYGNHRGAHIEVQSEPTDNAHCNYYGDN